MNTLRKIKPSAKVLTIIGNLYFPFLGAGIKTIRATDDFTEIDIRMKLKWYNRNYVGTHFGGSLYSMVDPFYMLMLVNNLGRDYIVWDKAAQINFLRPGRSTVFAYFKLSQPEILNIKNKTDELGKYIFDLPINIVDENKQLIAKVIKTMYVKRK